MDERTRRDLIKRDRMLTRYVAAEDLAEMAPWSDRVPLHAMATGVSLRNSEATERHPVTRTGEREPLAPQLRLWVLMRDRFACQFCGAKDTEFEVDHIIPWSAGGSDDATNLRTLCKPCNQGRSNKRDLSAPTPLPITECNTCRNVPDAGSTVTAWCPKCRRVATANAVASGRASLPRWSPLHVLCDWCGAVPYAPCTRASRKADQPVPIQDFHDTRINAAFGAANTRGKELSA